MSYKTFVVLFFFTLSQIHMFGQTEANTGFEDLLKKFPEMSIDDPYLIIDYSLINSKQVLKEEYVLKYFSIQLNFQEYCYPVGVYTFENFYLMRIQQVIYAKPKIIYEYLVSVSIDGTYIDKILSGGYSADYASTYCINSEIRQDRIITNYSVSKHNYTDDTQNDTNTITVYRLTEKGEMLKNEN